METAATDGGRIITRSLGWVDAECIQDLNGPLIFVGRGGDTLRICVCSEEGGSIFAVPLREALLSGSFSELEPNSVSQVLVAQSLIPGKYSFKSAYGRYITSDVLGKVAAIKEAVGPHEEWLPVRRADGFAFESLHGKFLSIDKDSGRLRGDADSIGFMETFLVRCQAVNKYKAPVEDEEGNIVQTAGSHKDLEAIEKAQAYARLSPSSPTSPLPSHMWPHCALCRSPLYHVLTSHCHPQRSWMSLRYFRRKFVSWKGGRTKLRAMSPEEMERAEREGRLHEALLNSRARSKHDPFC